MGSSANGADIGGMYPAIQQYLQGRNISSTGGANPFYGGGSNPLWPQAIPSSYNLSGQSFGGMTPPGQPPGQGTIPGQQHPTFSSPVTTPSISLPPPPSAPTTPISAYERWVQGGMAGREPGSGSR